MCHNIIPVSLTEIFGMIPYESYSEKVVCFFLSLKPEMIYNYSIIISIISNTEHYLKSIGVAIYAQMQFVLSN
jgi:hypothetical protein